MVYERRYVYDYGLPFSKCLAPALDMLKHRVMHLNKASFFIVEGGVGSGKSVASVQIGDYFNEAYPKDETGNYVQDKSKFIDLNLQYAMGNKDFMKKIVLCYRAGKNIIIYDEAGDYSKRGSLTKLNQDLNRLFEVCRAFKIIIVFVMPNFFYIDRSVLDKEMIRGMMRIRRESENYSKYKMWDINGINWIKWRSMKLPVPNQCYNYQKPIQEGCFLPLDEDRMQLLSKMSNKDKINIAENISKSSDMQKKFVSVIELVKNYNVSRHTIAVFINNHRIKCVHTVGRTFYYDPKDIEKTVKKWGMNTIVPKEEER